MKLARICGLPLRIANGTNITSSFPFFRSVTMRCSTVGSCGNESVVMDWYFRTSEAVIGTNSGYTMRTV